MNQIRDLVHDANGAFLAVYTFNNMETEAATSYSRFKTYFEPDYIIGSMTLPPCPIEYIPWSMVIDLKDGQVLGVDTAVVQLNIPQIMGLVDGANI